MKNHHESFTLTLTNTLTNSKEPFVPLHDEQVLLYVCGITPYDFPHLGHARVYVTFDVLYRLLMLFGYEVTYVRNFTDVDDKLIARAQKDYNDPHAFLKVAQTYIDAFNDDMKKLNCLPASVEPRVTTHMPEIIQFIHELIEKGKAYEANGDVYFSIDSFADYGALSKRDLTDQCAGARVEVRQEKRNPLDFALWKSAAQDQPGWSSPWGHGRPGWHIECSAMAKKHLGKTIDIHGGGMDLIFPHHENEIAQSQGLHDVEFARYWMHCAFVMMDKEKMSKSLGNFVSLQELLKMYDPMVVRYYIVQHHYRNPMEFSKTDLDAAHKSYQRLTKFFARVPVKDVEELCFEDVPLVHQLIQALADDMNIARFFGIIFEHLDDLANDPIQAGLSKHLINQVLGLTLEPLPEATIDITPEIQKLFDEREAARAAKDFKRADEIRDQLTAMGVPLQDKKIIK